MMIVRPAELVDRIEMPRTDCLGMTRLVLHIAHHELESFFLIFKYIVVDCNFPFLNVWEDRTQNWI